MTITEAKKEGITITFETGCGNATIFECFGEKSIKNAIKVDFS